MAPTLPTLTKRLTQCQGAKIRSCIRFGLCFCSFPCVNPSSRLYSAAKLQCCEMLWRLPAEAGLPMHDAGGAVSGCAFRRRREFFQDLVNILLQRRLKRGANETTAPFGDRSVFSGASPGGRIIELKKHFSGFGHQQNTFVLAIGKVFGMYALRIAIP